MPALFCKEVREQLKERLRIALDWRDMLESTKLVNDVVRRSTHGSSLDLPQAPSDHP